MHQPLNIIMITGLILTLSACSGGMESDLETALVNDMKQMQICGKFKTFRRVALNGLSNLEMKTYPVKGWHPTDTELKEMNTRGSLCFGNRTVNKIIEFTTPSDFAGMKITEVVFGYEMKLNDLARNLRIDEFIKDAYTKPLKAKAVLIETNNGWRVKNITWAPSGLFAKTRLVSSEKYDRQESPNCAACQDLLKNGVDFSNISKEVTGIFRDENHFSSSCTAVRQSCANQYNISF